MDRSTAGDLGWPPVIRATLLLYAATTGHLVHEATPNMDHPSASLCRSYGRLAAEQMEATQHLPLGAIQYACVEPADVSFLDDLDARPR